MDRVFLDANVLWSAAWRDQSEIAGLWGRSRVSLRTSAYAVDEARRNIADAEHLARLERRLEQVEIFPLAHASVGLPRLAASLPADDVPILLAAIASSSTHLLTGNTRDFRAFFGRRTHGVLVLKPRTYLDKLRAEGR